MAVATSKRPERAKSLVEIRRMGYEGERQRQITNGWYMRGKGKVGTEEWRPDPGLPGDVLVYLPMGAPYEREMYPDKGFFPLSDVPRKKAIAHRSPDFAILPPRLEVLQEAMALLKERRPEAIAETEEELADVEEQLSDTGGLMKGEAAQLRRRRKLLRERITKLKDDRQFDATAIYRQMVEERQEVLKAQMSPEQVRQEQLREEYRGWDEALSEFDGEAPTKASTSRTTATSKSTPAANDAS